MFLKKAMILSSLLLGALATADTRTLSCAEQPGAYLCSLLDDLKVDYGMRCTGDPCDTLWRTQGRDDLNLVRELGRTLVPSDVIAADLAMKAYRLANAICNTSRTGVGEDGYFAVDAENKLLPKLALLQSRGGYAQPRTCTISVY